MKRTLAILVASRRSLPTSLPLALLLGVGLFTPAAPRCLADRATYDPTKTMVAFPLSAPPVIDGDITDEVPRSDEATDWYHWSRKSNLTTTCTVGPFLGGQEHFLYIQSLDNNGLMVPRSKNLIRFSISGPGEIVATDNGDATDLVSFSSNERKAFNGLALAIVKAKTNKSGVITLTARSEGLTTATTTIKLK